MAILQYWCPEHHTTKRKTRFDGFREYRDGTFIDEKGNILSGYGKALVYLEPDGVLYRPAEIRSVMKREIIPMPEMRINCSLNSELPIVYYRVWLEDATGNILEIISEGKETPPQEIVWDWNEKLSGKLKVGESYILKASIKDKLGQELNFTSSPIPQQPPVLGRFLTSSVMLSGCGRRFL